VVVGPKELPKLLRTVAGFVRKAREMAAEFRSGVEDLAAEVEREVDPFADLRKQEGLRPGMSASEITEHILSNRDADEAADANVSPEKPAKPEEKTEKSENKSAKKESKSVKSESSDANLAEKTQKSPSIKKPTGDDVEEDSK